jgi:hypothetical protein
MTKYLVNLTNNLIAKNHFDFHSDGFRNGREGIWNDFLTHVKVTLEFDDVAKMNSETLGRIMCEFEVGDVMASKKELLGGVTFSGDCGDMLRGLVALCLAFAIRDRLDYSSDRNQEIPTYRLPHRRAVINGRPVSKKEFCKSMTRKQLDEIVREQNIKSFGDDHSVR